LRFVVALDSVSDGYLGWVASSAWSSQGARVLAYGRRAMGRMYVIGDSRSGGQAMRSKKSDKLLRLRM
jgi:hypothetical protein